jgi:regulation of enolase protein 1 (concanavalin A-like superfamily)
MDNFDVQAFTWTREPKKCEITKNSITIITDFNTDLWQRTYYGFRNDSAPVLQMKTEEKYFTFTVKTEFDSNFLFEQCGVAIYLDSDNWAKASIEYIGEHCSKLGSVVTNTGYSDWATNDISSDIKSMYYRLSRRESDYLIETSEDGINFKQMRIFHLVKGAGEISFGIYACSPLDSSFTAKFSEMELTDCMWAAHQ